MPLDSTKTRTTEGQKKDAELLILRSLAAPVKEENDVKKVAKQLQVLQLHLGIMFHKLYLSWMSVQDKWQRIMLKMIYFKLKRAVAHVACSQASKPLVGPVGQAWTHREMLNNKKNGE